MNGLGQARKSLWIETIMAMLKIPDKYGQARKSLWIETVLVKVKCLCSVPVRLVRACGSKP